MLRWFVVYWRFGRFVALKVIYLEVPFRSLWIFHFFDLRFLGSLSISLNLQFWCFDSQCKKVPFFSTLFHQNTSQPTTPKGSTGQTGQPVNPSTSHPIFSYPNSGRHEGRIVLCRSIPTLQQRILLEPRCRYKQGTVDGSEFPFPTTWDGHQTL